MTDASGLLKEVANEFAEMINEVDRSIGENRDYGEGIGPHNEDDQISALATEVSSEGRFCESIYTVQTSPAKLRYKGNQSADLLLESQETAVFIEAKLFRFQRANGNPSPQAFSKVFNPFQDRNPRSFIHDVNKLAESDVQAPKGFLGIYYRPVSGAGSEISGQDMASEFQSQVARWTPHSISVSAVSDFAGLQHPIHQRGSIITWILDEKREQWFSN